VFDICFSFELSLFAHEEGADGGHSNKKNSLIRVDWVGREQTNGKYDVNDRLIAYMEFEKSLNHHLPKIKSSFQEILYLEPVDRDGKKIGTLGNVKPEFARAKKDEDNVLVLSFKPNSLHPATNYVLRIGKTSDPDGIDKMINSELMDLYGLEVEISGCNCDP
jgi:hypothetical protein